MSVMDKIVDSIVEIVKPAVEEIEADQYPVTRNNYARYMAMFSQFAGDRGQATILAVALKKAGANAQGVDDALRVSF